MGVQLPEGVTIGWKPWPGGQTLALSCPAWEVLTEGNRGGGKTELALVAFSRYVGRWGHAWRGIIFAQKYKQLDDVVAKAKRLFKRVSPKAKFIASKSDYKFTWPEGEELLLRVGNTMDDYWEYHGQEFPYVHFEELTRWASDIFYEAMKSCCRSPIKGIPLKYSSNTNPFGAGHHWVKMRFIRQEDGEAIPPNKIIRTTSVINLPTGETLTINSTRARVNISLFDNDAIMKNNPEYLAKLDGLTNEAMRAAWFNGDWDIEVGGFLAGIWDKDVHVVAPFDIPEHWPRWRAIDWGFAKPYSVGWYTMDHDGVIYRYRELYGWGGKPDVGTRETPGEVAAAILKAEASERAAGIRFTNNPADNAIFANTSSMKTANGAEITVGKLFRDNKVGWAPSKKGPGSRVSGAQVVIDLLKREQFKVFSTCKHFIRTVPVLQPDDNNWDDVDTDQEDHTWDEVRYSLTSRHKAPTKDKGVSDNTPPVGSTAWLDMIEAQQARGQRSKYRRSRHG